MISTVLVVLASLLGLLLGPLLLAIRPGRVLPSWFEVITIGVIPGIILFRLMPDLYGTSGTLALIPAVVGFVTLGLFGHRHDASEPRHHHRLVLPALATHSLLDGTTLTLALSAAEGTVATAVLIAGFVLHRMSEGLFVVALVGRNLRTVAPRIGVIGAATVLGSLGGTELIERLPRMWLDGFIALGLGMMLRITIQQRGPLATRIAGVLTKAWPGRKADDRLPCGHAPSVVDTCRECS